MENYMEEEINWSKEGMCICERCCEYKKVGKVTGWEGRLGKRLYKNVNGVVKAFGGLHATSALCSECAKVVYDMEKIAELQKEVEKWKAKYLGLRDETEYAPCERCGSPLPYAGYHSCTDDSSYTHIPML